MAFARFPPAPADAPRRTGERVALRRPPTESAVRAVLASSLALLTLAACQPTAPVGVASDVPGTTWSLERLVLDGGEVRRGQGEQVSFGPEGSLSIASCNLCSGRYAVDDSVLTIDGPLACTRRACQPGTVELESHLEGTSTLRRDGAYLIVEPDSLAEQILFVPAEP